MGIMKARRSNLTTIGFDADDTLWHNERIYRLTEARFAAMLGEHAPAEDVSRRLLEAEKRNLHLYGFGIKGFTLSMIETAVEVTAGRVSNAAIPRSWRPGATCCAIRSRSCRRCAKPWKRSPAVIAWC